MKREYQAARSTPMRFLVKRTISGKLIFVLVNWFQGYRYVRDGAATQRRRRNLRT